MSQATGIKNNRISYIERGRMKPRPEELEVIAKALDVSVDALTTDESKFLEAIGDTV